MQATMRIKGFVYPHVAMLNERNGIVVIKFPLSDPFSKTILSLKTRKVVVTLIPNNVRNQEISPSLRATIWTYSGPSWLTENSFKTRARSPTFIANECMSIFFLHIAVFKVLLWIP